MTEIKSCKYTARARSYEFPHSGVNTTSLGNEFEKIEAALAIVFFPNMHTNVCMYACVNMKKGVSFHTHINVCMMRSGNCYMI